MAAASESCEIALEDRPDRAVRYWIMAHNRQGTPAAVWLEWAVVDMQARGPSLVATGPGTTRRGENFDLRVGWDDPSFLPGQRRVGYLIISSRPGERVGVVPIRIDRVRAETSMRLLHPVEAGRTVLAPGAVDASHFFDVPAGAKRLVVEGEGVDGVDLHLTKRVFPAGPAIGEAPPPASAVASATGPAARKRLEPAAGQLAAGRWHVELVNRSGQQRTVELRVQIEGDATPPRPGSYYNPARSGHGLFVYPAGDQWAAIWYTYLEDGTPTWYYLQAAAPAAGGVWTAPLYRSAWTGAGNHLTIVGRARITPTGRDQFQFTWELDGQAGSEPLVALGRGCPSMAGMPVDVSGHWFNPARSGTGYSIQLLPNYEMHIAFVYDSKGVPRFLIAERSGFGGPRALLRFEQLSGFCPRCDRPRAPLRHDVGVFERRFEGNRFDVDHDAIFVDRVPGFWTATETVVPLGGAGSTQGCTTE